MIDFVNILDLTDILQISYVINFILNWLCVLSYIAMFYVATVFGDIVFSLIERSQNKRKLTIKEPKGV